MSLIWFGRFLRRSCGDSLDHATASCPKGTPIAKLSGPPAWTARPRRSSFALELPAVPPSATTAMNMIGGRRRRAEPLRNWDQRKKSAVFFTDGARLSFQPRNGHPLILYGLLRAWSR